MDKVVGCLRGKAELVEGEFEGGYDWHENLY